MSQLVLEPSQTGLQPVATRLRRL